MSLLDRIQVTPETSSVAETTASAPEPLQDKPKVEQPKKPISEIEVAAASTVSSLTGVAKDNAGFLKLVLDVHRELLNIPDLGLAEFDVESPEEVKKIRATVEKNVFIILDKMGKALSRKEKSDIIDAVMNETIGLGPIENLIKDTSISEIMVNAWDNIYVERHGHLEKSTVNFFDDEHVKKIILRIVSRIGRRLDENMPMVDARLKDGSRVNAIIPPIALSGPTLTIRKFSDKALSSKDLIRFGSLNSAMEEFIRICVMARMNIAVSGGTGSGKTTLLNVLSSFIPSDERVITIEDSAELKLCQEHVITMETRPPNIENTGAITIRDLVRNSLRMRPDRIIVGEVRGGEALDMLQAMNTGHDGSMTTLHANSPRDAIARLESMVLMAGFELPLKAIRQQVASAFNLIIQQSRLQDGSRKITKITEVCGMEEDTVVLNDLFIYDQTGYNDKINKVEGSFKPTGMTPSFLQKIEGQGLKFPPGIFLE